MVKEGKDTMVRNPSFRKFKVREEVKKELEHMKEKKNMLLLKKKK